MQARVRLPNPFIAVDVEIIRREELGDVIIHFGVNQDRPYDGFLGFTAMRYAWAGGGG